MIDRDGQVVGLIFDGNIHSISGNYAYNATKSRSIAVDTAAIEHALRVIYRDPQLANELDTGAMRK